MDRSVAATCVADPQPEKQQIEEKVSSGDQRVKIDWNFFIRIRNPPRILVVNRFET